MPDFEKISKELARSGVTLKLLWMEYCEDCRQLNQQPFMYSQFCYHFQQFANKERATMLVPDNLKTGEDHVNDWFTPKINRTYREMAEHYNTAVIPVRVRKPKDKSGAEGTVGVVSTRIIAALRNRKFFFLEELNQAVRMKLEEHNNAPFTKREGSRYSVFQSQGKAFLQKLPTSQFELAQWKEATVQYNYHISVEKMQYSVPYEYIKQKVDVRLTKNMVEVFFNQNRIAFHRLDWLLPGTGIFTKPERITHNTILKK